MGRARKNTKNLLKHVEGLVKGNGIPKPEWLPLVQRCPPLPPPLNLNEGVPKIVFPQDRLIKIYEERNWDVAFDGETSLEFANEQLSLIENGIPERQAYDMLVEKYRTVDFHRIGEKVALFRGRDYNDEDCSPEDYIKQWNEEEYAALERGIEKDIKLYDELPEDEKFTNEESDM